MIKANELRIGNLLDHYGEIITVDGFCDIDVFNSESGDIPLHSVSPIPLTEEWLLRFGFKFKSYGYGAEEWKQWFFNGYHLNGFRCTTTGVELKYVHQLQNLYFALNGEELTIKE